MGVKLLYCFNYNHRTTNLKKPISSSTKSSFWIQKALEKEYKGYYNNNKAKAEDNNGISFLSKQIVYLGGEREPRSRQPVQPDRVECEEDECVDENSFAVCLHATELKKKANPVEAARTAPPRLTPVPSQPSPRKIRRQSGSFGPRKQKCSCRIMKSNEEITERDAWEFGNKGCRVELLFLPQSWVKTGITTLTLNTLRYPDPDFTRFGSVDPPINVTTDLAPLFLWVNDLATPESISLGRAFGVLENLYTSPGALAKCFRDAWMSFWYCLKLKQRC
ncbi:hypothetical protein V8G54_020973 [Vigna mungo]|uniref:Uncharacterized protein n=1 Tax=Vigna mungo TaxID=3915 RepID=A0AAQ3NEY8_VIGMU